MSLIFKIGDRYVIASYQPVNITLHKDA